jgi:hypothetical protein
MLNLDETEQRHLWNVAEEVFRTKDKAKRVALDPKLMAAGRRVLKKEWQTIKGELQGKGLAEADREPTDVKTIGNEIGLKAKGK